MRSMEWRDSIDSMEINGFPLIPMELMDSMESMNSMDSMDSMESKEIHGFPLISVDFHGINRICLLRRMHGKGRDG